MLAKCNDSVRSSASRAWNLTFEVIVFCTRELRRLHTPMLGYLLSAQTAVATNVSCCSQVRCLDPSDFSPSTTPNRFLDTGFVEEQISAPAAAEVTGDDILPALAPTGMVLEQRYVASSIGGVELSSAR
jgi:hypothetical protein